MPTTPTPSEIPLEQLLPHRPPMLVIERLLEAGVERCAAALTLRADGLYFDSRGFVPVWAIEMMAQGLSAGLSLAGGAERAGGRFGYLVAVDGFELLDAGALVPGAEATVEARVVADIPPALETEAQLRAGGVLAARGRLRLLVGVEALEASPAPTAPAEPLGARRGDGGRVEASLVLGADSPLLQGHFPGDPVLPAIGHLRLVEEAVSAALGEERRLRAVRRARFLAPVRPGRRVALSVELGEGGRLDWTVATDAGLASRGSGTA